MFSFIWYLYNKFFFTFQLKPNLYIKQDYPSIGQIIQKAKENNINIIFVIGGNSSELNNQQVRNLFYDKLATLLPGGTPRASELSTDARNILDIVSANYRVKWWTLILMKKSLYFVSKHKKGKLLYNRLFDIPGLFPSFSV